MQQLSADNVIADLFGPPNFTRRIHIVVPGEPVPKGRARARVIRSTTFANKYFAQMYTPKETVEYETRIAGFARRTIGDIEPYSCPCQLYVRAYKGVTQSWPVKTKLLCLSGVIRPDCKPDGDNYLKSALDGLNGIIYKDDDQVIDMACSKYYSDNPRLEIEIFL